MQAFEASKQFGPLKSWRGARARMIAGRIAWNLGSPKLGRALHRLMYREHPNDPQAICTKGWTILSERGPWEAWQFARKIGDLKNADNDSRASWLAHRSRIIGIYRDFERAEQWITEALTLMPNEPWIHVENASLWEAQDQYDRALETARHALDINPNHRPGIQAVAHLLQILDRDDEALAFLKDAVKRIENVPVLAQLAILQLDSKLYEELPATLDELERRALLLDKQTAKWLAGIRSDNAYYLGDIDRARELAAQVGGGFHKTMAERLAQVAPDAKRVLLDVPFVRQHHVTCAPATLSAISRYWKMPADHLAVVEAICYDGTPAHSERAWANDNGWHAREFTVTWDITRALLDRGIPFTLTTSTATSGHLQAVVGFDDRRGTIIIRDPFRYYHGEAIAEDFFKLYRSTGPRGMLLVPRDQMHRLDGIDLPDAEFYDDFFDVQRALVRHDRAAAAQAHERMAIRQADHRLTLSAKRSLASYDADLTSGLETTEAQLKLFPDDALLRLAKLSYIRTLGTREQRLEMLKEITADKNCDPAFFHEYARELKDDARETDEVTKLTMLAIRRAPTDGRHLHLLAGIHWNARRFEDAMELYRLANCVQDKNDYLANSYFVAARHFKQTSQVLKVFADRFERFGKRSMQPVQTLYWAYEQLDRTREAMDLLDRAMQMRPDDADLKLFAAMERSRLGFADEAAKLLEAARGKTPQNQWARTAAQIASHRGELAEALALWQQVLAPEPLAMDAQSAVARLLAETVSTSAALEHLRAATARFPHHYGLHQLLIEWLRDEGAAAAEPVIRHLIDIHPVDVWARRELSYTLVSLKRLDEAMEHAETALRLAPHDPSSHACIGNVHSAASRRDEAVAAYRQAITISVDADYAITSLMNLCETPAQRRESLAFVQAELVRQTIFGDGLLAYRMHARETLDANELLKSLREAHEARPDLWHAWSALVRELTDQNCADEAVALAKQATEQFGLLPRVWLDLANASRARGDNAGEADALTQALRINPSWSAASIPLAALHERAGEFQKSRDVLERAIRRTPRDAELYGNLADLLWRMNDREAAVAKMREALRLQPGHMRGWDVLSYWSSELGRPDDAINAARELTQTRPGEARSWMILARLLYKPPELEQSLEALGRAIELNPRFADAHDLRAFRLAEARRFDEAIAACHPAVWGDSPPAELRVRETWIEHARGNVAEAIVKIRAFLDDYPRWYWARCRLCQWLRETDRHAEYLAAAEALVTYWPLDEVSISYRAEARLRNRDRAGAKEDYRRAIQVAPQHEFALNELFTLQLDDDELDDAAHTVEIIRRHQSPAHALAAEVRLAAKGNAIPLVHTKLLELLAIKDAPQWVLESALSAFDRLSQSRELLKVLDEAIKLPTINPIAGVVFMAHFATRHEWHLCDRISRRHGKKGEFGRNAVKTHVEVLGKYASPISAAKMAWRYRKILAQSTDAWAAAGYAFIEANQHRRCAKWMSDWGTRKGVQSWMLVNLAAALRRIRKDALAHDASRAALALGLPDSEVQQHLLFLAADEIRAGASPAEAAHLMSRVPGAKSEQAYYAFIATVVNAALGVWQSPPEKLSEALHKAEELFISAESRLSNYTNTPELLRIWRGALKRIANSAARQTPWWCRRRLLRPPKWLIMLIVLTVAFIASLVSSMRK